MDFYWNLNFQAVNLQLVGNKTLAFLNYSDNCNFKFNYGVCIKESLIILWERVILSFLKKKPPFYKILKYTVRGRNRLPLKKNKKLSYFVAHCN